MVKQLNQTTAAIAYEFKASEAKELYATIGLVSALLASVAVPTWFSSLNPQSLTWKWLGFASLFSLSATLSTIVVLIDFHIEKQWKGTYIIGNCSELLFGLSVIFLFVAGGNRIYENLSNNCSYCAVDIILAAISVLILVPLLGLLIAALLNKKKMAQNIAPEEDTISRK